MFLKSDAEFWDNPLHLGFRLGGYNFSAKLLDAAFSIG